MLLFNVVVMIAIVKVVSCATLSRMSQIASTAIRNAVGITVSASIMAGSLPSPSYALEASKLYAQAEEAIQVTQKEYKGVEDSWTVAKKNIVESSRLLGKNSELIKEIKKNVDDLESKVGKVNTVTAASIASIETEIQRLTDSTAIKYDLAQQAEATPSKINSVRKLFKDAEIEATILAQEYANVKGLRDSISKSNLILTEKSKAINTDLTGFLKRADDIQIKQGEGLADLIDGLNKNINACHYGGSLCDAKEQNGLSLFRKGYDEIGQAQDNFAKLSRDVQRDYKDVEFITSQLAKASTSTHTALDQLENWEKETSTRVKVGKTAIKNAASTIDQAYSTSKTILTRFATINDILIGKNDKKTVENDKLVKETLKNTLTKLDKAEREGVRTEKLLRDAKAQGDKEARSYLKSIPVKNTAIPSATASTIKASTATTTTGTTAMASK